MIKQNRRVPGTINSTPINRIKLNYPNQNQTLPISHPPPYAELDGSYDWKRETTSWKYRNLQERYQSNEEYRLVQLDGSEKDMTDVQKWLDPDIKLHLVSVLNLSNNSLTSIPAPIFNKLSNLCKLYLSNNKIDKISFPYFKENKLKIIDISCNKLKSLNLQHIDSLIKLNCSNNQLSFLTLPPSVQFLDCSSNKMSNIYFMEHCYELQEVNIADNMLYDLKFSFKPYIRFKQQSKSHNNNEKRYEYLGKLDCSFNKIQFIEGMDQLPNLKILMLNNNQISLTRHIMNQLFLLHSLETLNLQNNPLQSSGFPLSQILTTILSRLPALTILNGQDICDMSDITEGFQTDRKSHFSGINEEPYQLFMESHRKAEDRKGFENAEWNFTLGDCENQPKQSSKIHQLSEIEVINPCDLLQPQHIHKQPSEELVRTDLQQTYHLGLLSKQTKDIKLKVLKSSAPLIPHHIFYQQFLAALLPMSYIPASPLPLAADLTSGRRLDPQDDEYALIQRMFQNRGGVTYVKKVNRWNVLQNDREIFAKSGEAVQSSIGFLLNDLSEGQFRELCKFNKLVKRGELDIIGMQPNAFTYFHALVRTNLTGSQDYYQCAYFIETAQL